MNIEIVPYSQKYIKDAIDIWNEIVNDGVAFPQTELLTEESGNLFFSEQSFTGIAIDEETNKPVGLYILHPNNIG